MKIEIFKRIRVVCYKSYLGHDFKIHQEEQFMMFCQNFLPLDQIVEYSEIAIHLYSLYWKSELRNI